MSYIQQSPNGQIGYGGTGLFYEEGTWTPTLEGSTAAGTPTYTSQVGNYIRVGNLVTAWFRVSVSAMSGATGDALVGGLPFAASNTGSMAFSAALGAINSVAHASSNQQFGARLGASGSKINLCEFGVDAGGTTANVPASAIVSGTLVNGTLQYRIG